MRPTNPAEHIRESRRVQGAIQKVDDRLPEELRSDKLEGKITTAEAAVGKTETAHADLAAAVEEKNIALRDLTDFGKRLRSAVKAIFGDDSLIYEEVGGKRRSERKRPTKKSTTD